MDRFRFTLAVLLSTLIIFGWPFLMHRLFPPQPPNQPVAPEERPQQQTQQPIAAPLPAPQTAQEPQREIIVDAPLWQARLSNRGAVIVSWSLKKYTRSDGTEREIKGADGGTLELVSRDALDKLGAPLRLLLAKSPEMADRLNSVNFHISGLDPDRSTIELGPGQRREITFSYSSPEVTAVKTLTFYGDGYMFELRAEVLVNGAPQQAYIAFGPRFGDQSDKMIGSYATPHQAIAQTKSGKIERKVGSEITNPIAEITRLEAAGRQIEIDEPLPADLDWIQITASDEKTLLGYARIVSREGPQKLTLDALPQGATAGCHVAPATEALKGGYRWAGLADHYFAMVVIPNRPVDQIVLANAWLKSQTEKPRDYPSLAVPVGQDLSARIFVGPKDRKLLERIGAQVGADLEGLIDYGIFAFAIRPLIPIIGWSLDGLARIFHNYGWAIVAVTLIINLALSPLRFYSSKKMKKAAKHQPRIKELQDRMKKLKENPKKYQREIEQIQREQLELMKEANPLGGCLPLILQLPIFWAFFVYLTISLDVRHAPWILWVRDLSAPDPYKILPVIMCATMIGSTVIMPMPKTDDPAMKMQRVLMSWVMPILLTWLFFLSAPSGLVLYWMVSSLAGMGIQLAINRLTAEPEAAAETSGARKRTSAEKEAMESAK
jgi:YidC/Oxa1 family membrane protein insertase